MPGAQEPGAEICEGAPEASRQIVRTLPRSITVPKHSVCDSAKWPPKSLAVHLGLSVSLTTEQKKREKSRGCDAVEVTDSEAIGKFSGASPCPNESRESLRPLQQLRGRGKDKSFSHHHTLIFVLRRQGAYQSHQHRETRPSPERSGRSIGPAFLLEAEDEIEIVHGSSPPASSSSIHPRRGGAPAPVTTSGMPRTSRQCEWRSCVSAACCPLMTAGSGNCYFLWLWSVCGLSTLRLLACVLFRRRCHRWTRLYSQPCKPIEEGVPGSHDSEQQVRCWLRPPLGLAS